MGTLQGVPCPWGSASRPPYLLDRGPRPCPTPMAELPSWGAPGGRLRGPVLVFWGRVLWFSGLFSKHRSRIDVILEPLRRYLRYGRNGPCFVGFKCRLTLQTCRNVGIYHRKGLSGDPAGGPLALWEVGHPMADLHACGARLWPSPNSRAPQLVGSGLGHASSISLFPCVSYGFRGFFRSTEFVSMRLLNRCEAIFDTD